jgi:predicted transcriptional regulator
MAKVFIEEILNEGGGEFIAPIIKKEENGKTSYYTEYLPHKGYFLKVPESVRRCYYLEPNEKQVLFELYSWADDNGKAKIPIDLIALKLGITEKTVRQTVKSLDEKDFISIKKEGRANVYIMSTLKNNPYLVLSEFIHQLIIDYYYKKNIQTNLRECGEEIGEQGVRKLREAIANNLSKVVKRPEVYQPFIDRLRNSPDDYFEIIEDFTNVIDKKLEE